MNITKLSIPFQVIYGEGHLILLEVRPVNAYVDGKKTDTLEGFRFIVVEDKTFEKLSVKIACTTPAITQEQLESAKDRIYVKFDNAFAKPYRTRDGDYDLSITAAGISIVK